MGGFREQESLIFTPVLTGGLGNLLYQISATLSVAIDRKGKAIFYLQKPQDSKDHRPFGGHELIKKHGLPQNLQELFPKLNFYEKPILASEVRRRGQVFHEMSSLKYFQVPTNAGTTVLEGYFFHLKHYKDNLPQIIEQLKPSSSIENHIGLKYGHLFDGDTVSVHLRLGNTNDNYKVPDIPTKWYQQVFEELPQDLKYIVCSDNQERAKDFMKTWNRDFYFVENEPMYIDLFIMARCQYNVLHNSTLSAWVGLLNKNPGKKVFYHDRCFSAIHGMGSVPKDWVDPSTVYRLLGRKTARLIYQLKRPKIMLASVKRDLLFKLSGNYYILNHEMSQTIKG